MKLVPACFILFLTACMVSCDSRQTGNSSTSADQSQSVTFNKDTALHKVDVIVNGELFTTFRWPDMIAKPVLYPVLASSGTGSLSVREFI